MVITRWPLRVTAIQTVSIQGGIKCGGATLLLPFTFSHLAPGALSGPINPLLSTRMAPHYRPVLMSSLLWWGVRLWKQHVGAVCSFNTSGGTVITDLIAVLDHMVSCVHWETERDRLAMGDRRGVWTDRMPFSHRHLNPKMFRRFSLSQKVDFPAGMFGQLASSRRRNILEKSSLVVSVMELRVRLKCTEF